jgi:hypothetical protein
MGAASRRYTGSRRFTQLLHSCCFALHRPLGGGVFCLRLVDAIDLCRDPFNVGLGEEAAVASDAARLDASRLQNVLNPMDRLTQLLGDRANSPGSLNLALSHVTVLRYLELESPSTYASRSA